MSASLWIYLGQAVFGTEAVTFRITDVASGEPVAAVAVDGVAFVEVRPNGPDCPPVCFVSQITV